MVRKIRMHQARRLLVQTDLPLQDIAERVGYGTGFALSKAFKCVYGEAPAHLRASHQ